MAGNKAEQYEKCVGDRVAIRETIGVSFYRTYNPTSLVRDRHLFAPGARETERV